MSIPRPWPATSSLWATESQSRPTAGLVGKRYPGRSTSCCRPGRVRDGARRCPLVRPGTPPGRRDHHPVQRETPRRAPRASLYVVGDDFWSYVVLDGTAELTPVAADPVDETVDELVALYRAVADEHPNGAEFRRDMVADGRLVVRLHFDHAYGMVPTS